MIIVKLMGGLGNQMFQYAAGKSLATRLGVALKIDTSFLEDRSYKKDFTFRNFELSCFNIKDDFISKGQLERFYSACKIFDKLKLNRLNQIFFKNKMSFHKIIRENIDTQKIDTFNSISNNTLLEGYWQSEIYFFKYQNIIREFFKFKNSNENSDLQIEITKNNSVSVHIRRGDYANNEVINSVHGLCTIEYYIQAFQIMSSKIANPIFSFCTRISK